MSDGIAIYSDGHSWYGKTIQQWHEGPPLPILFLNYT